jgi:tryptophan-rich sensory protein
MTEPAAGRSRGRGRLVLASIAGVLVVNLLGIGSAAMSGPMAGGSWYSSLTLPALQPPGPVFGIAWTILYTLLGLAAARLWVAPPSPARRRALALFALQLLLNLAWSPLFFSAQQIAPALALIVAILLAAILATLAARRVDGLAPWLMLPYLVWLGFALMLNWRILALNPGA